MGIRLRGWCAVGRKTDIICTEICGRRGIASRDGVLVRPSGINGLVLVLFCTCMLEEYLEPAVYHASGRVRGGKGYHEMTS